MKSLILYIPYIFVFVSQMLPAKPWFFPGESSTYISLSIVFFSIQSILLYGKSKKGWNLQWIETFFPPNWSIAGFYFLFMLLFPLRNRNWGDGLLLLETNLLETKLFGFQFTLDEILESILHSNLTQVLNYFHISDDPVVSYAILSYAVGVFFLFGFLILGKQKPKDLSILILLSSGGILLGFGYAEHYTLVTAVHLGLYLFLYRFAKDPKDCNTLLYGSTSIVALAMLFHLVSGYLVILLVYLWVTHSPKEKKIQHLFYCTILGTLILFPWFLYFSIFHDPTVDQNSTHLIHPPFYPMKRWISLNHVKEISSVLIWNVFFSAFYLLYQWTFQKETWKHFVSKPNHQTLFVVVFCFFLHGFFHNPQLGFPADWDLMGFYWLPITVLAFLFWKEKTKLEWEWIPVLVFSVLLVMVSAFTLNKSNTKDDLVWEITKKAIHKYSEENQLLIQSFPKEEKKFFAKGDFLFFKGEYITNQLCDFPEKELLKSQMMDHRKNWKAGFLSGKFKVKTELNAFLTEATKTNVLYLKSLEANTICHPKL
ncbi:dolichyl-phosphate-mannose--protein mannosyltransferase [Leptospira jelokensis]|uniref:Dolichyl-phosphate-mannose--protein mannosyltransferase n=1 Tax=Leptospira jelokensis TaxID=2484931 RepID=A0A4Z1A087_9LEPT|nr:dolichyl-phosphate-mannose--protein mannosyltransferase [Leptospira jelokensis]TGL59905.1 dolichyl-phosphate-mannose--protein mannosyltransferase [Leptospira jelokensis]